MLPIVKKDTLDYPVSGKFLAVIAGQVQRRARFVLESQYIITVPTSETVGWETPETDMDTSHDKIDFEKFASIEKRVAGLPIESDIESMEDVAFRNYLDFLHPSVDESDFDVDTRLVPPPMKKGHLKVKFKFLGKLPPRINFDPERD